MAGIVNNIEHHISRKLGLNHLAHPKTTEALDEVKKLSQSGGPVNWVEFNTMRELLNNATASPLSKDAMRAHEAVDMFQNSLERLGPAHVRSGNPRVAMALHRQGVDLWKKKYKAERIERAFFEASNSGMANREQALRTAFRKITNDKKMWPKYSKQEQRAIKKVTQAGNVEMAARKLGNWALSRGSIRGVGASLVAEHLGGLPGVAAEVAITEGASRAAEAATRRAAEAADIMVRQGDNKRVRLWPGAGEAARMGAFRGSRGQTEDINPQATTPVNPFMVPAH